MIRAAWNALRTRVDPNARPASIDVLMLGGMWFPHGDGISATFARHLDPVRVAPRFVEYPADYFSLTSTSAAIRWGRSLLDAVTRSAVQRWWSREHRQSWTGAMAFARGYLFDGRHADAYLCDGHVLRLAEAMNAEAGTAGSKGRM